MGEDQGVTTGEVGFADELMLMTQDVLASEIWTLNGEIEELDRQIMELSAIRKQKINRYHLLLPRCNHHQDHEWCLDRMDKTFAESQVRCRICQKQMTCPHPNNQVEPTMTGFHCHTCNVTKNYHKGERFTYG